MPSQGLSGSPGAVPDVLTDCDGGRTTCGIDGQSHLQGHDEP